MSMLYRIKNTLYRGGMRLLMPDLARQMEQEGNFALPTGGQTAPPEYIRVEDNGADTTIFAFSGLDVLYAGLARYEFQRVLHQLGTKANFVFIRDVHRMGFQLRPDGTAGGLDFYAAEIMRVKESLGARRNVAIGSSIGGSAAFAFGVKCQMDEIVIFGAAFSVDAFTTLSVLAKTLGNIRVLIREPRAYFELLIVTLAARWTRKNLVRRVGEENVTKPLRLYAESNVKPAITLFYGANSPPDAKQAQLLTDFQRARLVPLPTGRHNTPSFLKSRGELAARIAEALENPPGNSVTAAA